MIHARFFRDWIRAKMDMEEFCEINKANIEKVKITDMTCTLFDGQMFKWFIMDKPYDAGKILGFEFATADVGDIDWDFHSHIKARVRRTYY